MVSFERRAYEFFFGGWGVGRVRGGRLGRMKNQQVTLKLQQVIKGDDMQAAENTELKIKRNVGWKYRYEVIYIK